MLAAKMEVSTARGLDSVAGEIIRAIKAASVGGSVPPERVDYATQELVSIRRQMLVVASPGKSANISMRLRSSCNATHIIQKADC